MRFLAMAAAAVLAGCASYSWKSSVPPDLRRISVSVFRNESDVTGLGEKVAAQVLRELQREGTFEIVPLDECDVEIQGVVKSDSVSTVAYERRTGARTREHSLKAVAEVSFVNKAAGTVVENRRKYSAATTFLANDDITTGAMDASGRLAEDFARQIVDDALDIDWKKGAGQ